MLKIPLLKNTAKSESVKMPSPKMVILPMKQHIGAPCQPAVKAGDKVAVGQVVGDSDEFLSAPIHSPVSGVVVASGADEVRIENDGMGTLCGDIKAPEVKNREDFLRAVRQSGIVGLGGAGFPTHAKLALKDGVKVDTLIINGAECEPYITSDHREMIENPDHVQAGIDMVKEYIGIKNHIIATKTKKAGYPYGAERVLVKALTGRRVPRGGLPVDVGVMVLNVSTVSAISQYMGEGIPLIQRRITVDGQAVAKPQNVIVSIGVQVRDIIEFCGGFACQPERVVVGGPMMGRLASDDTMPIVKYDNAIICLTTKQTYTAKDNPCIRCGRCLNACPTNLAPLHFAKTDMSACIKCGSCAYVCPAKRPLVELIAKVVLKNA